MRLAKCLSHAGNRAIGQLDSDWVIPLDLSRSPFQTLADILEDDDPAQTARSLLDPARKMPTADVALLAPIDQQEVWAAGVTYQRSQVA
jgi:2-dehydro-3-deoxy-D-arabinonate dehydratase